jgi:hypothetical protein
MKDDKGVTLDYVKIDRTKEIFHYGTGVDKKTYNVIRNDEMYDIKLIGLVFTKVVYFYNVNNPNPLNFNKKAEGFEPVVSPRLYNRMIENEILIKLNTLDSNVNWRMLLIIAGICLIAYLAYSSGMFGSPTPINATMNMSNMTNSTGNFTNIGIIKPIVSNVSHINLSNIPRPGVA